MVALKPDAAVGLQHAALMHLHQRAHRLAQAPHSAAYNLPPDLMWILINIRFSSSSKDSQMILTLGHTAQSRE